MTDYKITVIGGGRMGEALCLGVVKTEFAKLENINVIEPLLDRADFLRKEHSLNVFSEYDDFIIKPIELYIIYCLYIMVCTTIFWIIMHSRNKNMDIKIFS